MALVGVVSMGVAMRWGLAGRVPLVWDLARLRHAHAHLAYYGLLVPLAWCVWAACGLSRPGPRTLVAYALAVAAAIVGFLRAGYAPEAIVGSTVVGGIWWLSAVPSWRRMPDRDDPLAALLPGMTLALACVPFVARTTRRDPAMALAWVSTFLAALLLLVVVPSALAARGARRPWPALLVFGTLGALALGVWPHSLARLGLAVFGLLLLPVRWPPMPAHLSMAWAGLGLGAVAMATGWLPNVRPVVLGAIHFAALSVALPSFAGPLGLPDRHAAWGVHHGAVGLLCVPLVLQAFGAGRWTWDAAALGGSLLALELLGVGLMAVHRALRRA